MTKAKISEYDAVAANNTDVNGVNIDEGCAPSGMNNMGREIMAALKRFETGADGDSLTVGGNLIVSGTVTAANTATLGNVDVNGGTIDGAVIGGSTPAAGSFTTLNTSGAVVFNDAGADVDFRVEGDTDANLLFVDASTDRVGIGTNAPALTLHVLSNNDPALFEATAANKKLLIRETSDSNSNAGIYIQKKHSTLHPAGHWYGDIYFQGWDGSAFRAGALIEAVAEGTPAASSMPGQLRFSTNGGAVDATERMRITSGGQLAINTTSSVAGNASAKFVVKGASGADVGEVQVATNGTLAFDFRNSSGTQAGSITVNASTVAYNTSSDYRLKENVVPMAGALAKVLELNPVTYTWKVDGSAGEGFIAHELQAVCPEAVSGEKDATQKRQVTVSPAVPATYDEDGNELTPAVETVYEEREVPVYQGVDTSFLVATLTAAIQELSAKNDALEARIAALETGA
jgi:hypothetical protein